MIYDVVVPLAGFDAETQFELEPIDSFFSMIRSKPNNIEIRVINLEGVDNIQFDIDDEVAKKLELDENSKYSVHYIFVLQKPIEKSIINFLAPIIINDDKKKMAQIQLDLDYLGLETLEKYL